MTKYLNSTCIFDNNWNSVKDAIFHQHFLILTNKNKQYTISSQKGDKHIYTHTDIATLWLTRPRGPNQWKSYIQETLNRLMSADSSTNIKTDRKYRFDWFFCVLHNQTISYWRHKIVLFFRPYIWLFLCCAHIKPQGLWRGVGWRLLPKTNCSSNCHRPIHQGITS